LSTNSEIPQRGEVWLVNFDPTLGSEIKKVRPAIVISSDAVGKLPIKLVAPATDWKAYFAKNLWHVRIEPEAVNGLSKTSAVDVLQLRGVDFRRFIRRLGKVSDETMTEITIAILIVIDFQL
jgi:mRNA interferase MazF